MKPELNKKYLITTDAWFTAPDGQQYKAVFGTVTAVNNDEATLGIKTNRGSANWYVNIGNMIIAGCQIHYCIKTDQVDTEPKQREIEHNGELKIVDEIQTRIYCADESQQ